MRHGSVSEGGGACGQEPRTRPESDFVMLEVRPILEHRVGPGRQGLTQLAQRTCPCWQRIRELGGGRLPQHYGASAPSVN